MSQYQPSLALLGTTVIISRKTINVFHNGILHAHPGLLPMYRGNYPVRWSILNGDDCGITVLFIDSGIDTGPILAKQFFPIQEKEPLNDFEERISLGCAEFLVSVAQRYLSGEVESHPQNVNTGNTYGLMSVRCLVRLYIHLLLRDRR
jgi:methionyl-tRNA formyltransferase